MEKLKESHEEFTNLLESVTNELTELEKDVEVTSKEISETVEKLNSTECKETGDDTLEVEVLEGNKRAMVVDGERIEYETTETKYEKLTEDATDEEIHQSFAKYEIEEDTYKDLDRQQRIELINIFREREALVEEYQEIQKKFNEEIQEINKEYNKAMLEGNMHDIVEALKEKKELYLKYNKKSAAQQIDNLIEEVEGSLTLNVIKKSTSKIKNHKKIIDNFETGLEAAHKKFYSKLKKNRQSKFIYRENLEEELMKRYDLSEFNAKLFTYIFYGFAHNERIISRYSVLINEIIKNICTDCLQGEDKNKFRQSILEVIAIVCE